MTSAAGTVSTGKPGKRLQNPYRYDIDGLRAVAILLVVIYHVWMDRVSGGVDVFLIISAFFLTLTMSRRITDGLPLRIGSFLAGRFRRLVPTAAVTIVLILGASWIFVSSTQWPSIWREGWASLFYVENWQLAFSGVDYYARDSTLPSPFQHFWSLSVQGQVFVLWPLIFLLGAALARWMKRSAIGILAVLFGAVFAASLTYSIIRTQTDQTFAYFDTGARLWEFAAGSLLALALPYIRLHRALASALGWIGLVAIAVCGVVIDVRGGFPGFLALWPVLATAMVVIGGIGNAGPARFLAARPLRFIGRDAYALYLVHWPILILWLTVVDSSRAGALDGVLIIALSVLLARILTFAVETPLRLPRGESGTILRNLVVVALCALPVVAVTSVWQLTAHAQADAAEAQADAYQGAAGDTADAIDVPLLPNAIDLDSEWVSLDEMCSGRLTAAEERVQVTCEQTSDADAAGHLVIVVGDSHAEQMMAALRPIADEDGWGVVGLLHGGCSLERHDEDTEKAAECAQWREGAIAYIDAVHPDAVATIVTAAEADGPNERMLAGIDDVTAGFAEEGMRVIGVRDNPRFGIDMYECALVNGDCDRAVGDAMQLENPAAELADWVTLIDFTPQLCPDGICRAAIGNIAVYIDDNHLTKMFAKTLAPAMRAQLGGEIG
ncbi:acyltransferase family protein [Microbacterium shaanxiense]